MYPTIDPDRFDCIVGFRYQGIVTTSGVAFVEDDEGDAVVVVAVVLSEDLLDVWRHTLDDAVDLLLFPFNV